jgi:hypothetical protein
MKAAQSQQTGHSMSGVGGRLALNPQTGIV